MKTVFAFGRMNPPTIGHERVVELLREEARREGSVPRLYLTESHDQDRNPLNPKSKLEFAQRLFPGVDVRLTKTLFAAFLAMAEEGLEEGELIVGADRQTEFSELLSRYEGTDKLGLKRVEVKAVDRASEDASATKARSAALDGDLDTFRALMPSASEDLVQDLYEAVRNGLGVTDGERVV